ncbi:MAG TPA: OmpA family protein [Bacteroidales bacterium]|nr:OmpA family protein [Bacteroidales bacterium]
MTRLFFSSVLILLMSARLSAQSANASELMNKGCYAEASVLFEKTVTGNNPEYSDLTNLAYCYIMMHDFVKAEAVYERILQHPKKENIQHFYYGEVLRINGKYDKAKEQYDIYKTAFPDDFKADQRIRSCDSIALWNKNKTKYSTGKIFDLNTDNDEMFPWMADGVLHFSSNSRFLLEKNGATSNYKDPQIFNIFVYKNNSVALKKIAAKDSSSFTAYVPAYGKELLLTKKIKVTPTGEELSPSEISVDKKTFIPSGAPQGYTFSHPCLAGNGKRMYFVSDMPGGFGGTDIYYSDFDGTSWSTAVNAGNNINTPGDEMFPYITAHDSLLYFSSDGHPGYGNMDIFVSRISSGKWSSPVNMKAPVNSIGNDFSMVYKNYPWDGYLVSNRYPDSKGGNDIFSFSFEKPTIIKPVDTTKPFVYNADPSLLYAFFETGSSEIAPEYKSIMDSLIGLMKKYDYLNLSVTSFADVRGTEKLNAQLVQERMNAVSGYFSSAGISSSRIIGTPGKTASDREIPNLTFHVQIGFVAKENQEAYFEWRTYNKYKVSSFKKKNGYTYFTGNGSLNDMQALARDINTLFNLGAYVIVSYRGIVFDDTFYAPNRRVEMKLFNK